MTRPTDDAPAAGRTWAEDAPTGEAPAAEVERYELGVELGRGGLGRVRVAFDQVLGREVARKELLRTDPAHRRRFAREARLTARLDHPAIVPILDAGTAPDGLPFYTMKRLPGTTLTAAIAAAPDLPGRLRLVERFLAACDAIAYAHDRGVVHRDLKPDNLVVGGFGETWVVDWGLAQALDEPARESDTVAGTPAWMSPEQARGERAGPPADVWALGAVLYGILAGRAPYDEATREAALEAARTARPPRLGDLEPATPPALGAIVERAMATAPGDRYPTAAALAADVRAWLAGERVGAHRYGLGEALLLVGSRYRRWLAGAAVLGAIVIVAVSRIRAEQAARVEVLASALATAARDALATGHLPVAERLAAESLRYVDGPDARGVLAASRATWGASLSGGLEVGLGCARMARSGRWLACASREGFTAFADGEPVWTWPGVRGVAVSVAADGRVAALAPGTLAIFGPDGSRLSEQALARGRTASFGPDGTLAWADDHAIHVSDRPEPVVETRSHPSGIAWLGPDRLAISCADGTVLAVGRDGSCAETLEAGRGLGLFVRAGRGLLVGRAGEVVWRRDDGTERRFDAGGGYVADATFSPNGRYLAGATDTGRVVVWDADSGERVALLADGLGSLASVAWGSDGSLDTGGAGSRWIRRWRPLPATPPGRLSGGPSGYAIADGVQYAVFSGGTLVRWPLGTSASDAERDRTLSALVGSAGAVAASGHRLWTTHPDARGLRRLTEVDTDRREVVWDVPLPLEGSLVLEPTGLGVLAANPAGWRLHGPRGELVATGDGMVESVTPSGLLLVQEGGGLAVRQLPDGVSRPVPGSARVDRAALSPDGRWVASVTHATVGVTALDGSVAWERALHTDVISRIAFVGADLVTASWDRTLLVSDPETGAPVARLRGGDGRQEWFAAADRTLVAVDWDGVPWTWDLAAVHRSPAELVAEAEQRTGLGIGPTGELVFDAAKLPR